MITTCALLRAAGGEQRSTLACRGGPLSQQGLSKKPPLPPSPPLIAAQLYFLQAESAASNWLMNNFKRAVCGSSDGPGGSDPALWGLCAGAGVNQPPRYPQGSAPPRLSDLKGSVKDQAGLLFTSPVFPLARHLVPSRLFQWRWRSRPWVFFYFFYPKVMVACFQPSYKLGPSWGLFMDGSRRLLLGFIRSLSALGVHQAAN